MELDPPGLDPARSEIAVDPGNKDFVPGADILSDG